MVNKSTILNRFVHHTLQRNITRLAVITRKTNIKLGILKGGTGKEPKFDFIMAMLNLFLKPELQTYVGSGKNSIKKHSIQLIL